MHRRPYVALILLFLLFINVMIVTAQEDENSGVIVVQPGEYNLGADCTETHTYPLRGTAGEVVDLTLQCRDQSISGISNISSCMLSITPPSGLFVFGESPSLLTVNSQSLTNYVLPADGLYAMGVTYGSVEAYSALEDAYYCEPIGYELSWSKLDAAFAPILDGMNMAFTGDYAGALQEFDRVVAEEPDNALAYHGRAIAKLHLQQNDAALADLDTAVSLDANNPDILFYRGNVHLLLGNSELALADHLRVEELDPGSNQYWIGLSYLSTGDNAQARVALQLDQQTRETTDIFNVFWIGISYIADAINERDEAIYQQGTTILLDAIERIQAAIARPGDYSEEDQHLYARAMPLLFLIQDSYDLAKQAYTQGMFATSRLPHDRLNDRVYLYLLTNLLQPAFPGLMETRDWFDNQVYSAEAAIAEANAGGTEVGENLIVNGRAEQPLENGEIPGWENVSGSWTTDNYIAPFEGNVYFFASVSNNAELAQTVDVTQFAESIDAGTQDFTFSVQAASYYGFSATDATRVVVEYRDDAGAVLDSFDSGEVFHERGWEPISDTRTAPVGTRSIRVRLMSIRYGGFDNDGYFDAVTLVAQ